MTLNLNSLTDISCNPSQLSPLTLAFIGDTVFDLFVREMLISEANRPVGKLHALASQRVCAGAQAAAVRRIREDGLLTDEEETILKRGRNAHTARTPKNSTEADYHLATGLEALFGYLYLSGNSERLNVLFKSICEAFEKEG